MTALETAPGFVGTSVKRKEDASLLRGRGTFVENLTLPAMLHMVVVRSPYPHARVRSAQPGGTATGDPSGPAMAGQSTVKPGGSSSRPVAPGWSSVRTGPIPRA